MARPLVPLISVDALVTAALELVDEAGDFSLPKLAKRIGVSQSSIYNHVSGREEILELMRGRIIAELPYVLGDDQDWEASLRAIVRSYRDAFARHPRLAPLLVLQTVQDPQVLALYENLAVALRAAGFTGRDVVSAISTIDSFALGFALDLAAPDVVWAPPQHGYPTLTHALSYAGPPTERGEAAFEFGLEILIAGLHSRLQSTVQ
ncbi:TetR/AcrR family transcriptional regulator C-terminal domain-containing protein [Paenarthrobacter sp. UW852]|uniref:TetR/AcrR family transcriptional regulator C-terminal domain-containing protein n=1 Tax=Paenarthrobacter sp. UW852 TaxID=2951989 RepID=UPI0021496206|nr:TetR/AcrR family transcriptional regulator C-terminal domain-containing protein [Paenarthrobacter sp. UW852]MCR1160223.1 TetR/AcrR family transcriptional regulator C-terminal domain-containing protein [Paenarthrobacter sp. UW852]